MPQRTAQFPVIDGFEFAQCGAAMDGRWPVNDLPRLRSALYSDAGSLDYHLRGARDEQGRPALKLGISGALRLTCQRCLGRMDFALRVDAMLVLVATQAEIDAGPVEPDEPERVLGGKDMAVRDLLEDEVLLALPYVPRHEHCDAEAGSGSTAQPSPFAGLRDLLASGRGGPGAGKKRA